MHQCNVIILNIARKGMVLLLYPLSDPSIAPFNDEIVFRHLSQKIYLFVFGFHESSLLILYTNKHKGRAKASPTMMTLTLKRSEK